jgi:hypothetical protein
VSVKVVVRTVEGVKAPVGDGGPVASGLRVAVDEKDTLTEAEGLLEAEAEEVAVAVSVAVAVVACSLRTGAPEHSCMMSNALIKRAQEGTICGVRANARRPRAPATTRSRKRDRTVRDGFRMGMTAMAPAAAR